MVRLDVRRLAAVDMWGGAGTKFRRRAILVEFLVGALAGPALGLWIVTSTTQVGWLVFGAWLIGVGLNYAPPALYAIALSPAGRLERELEGVDVAAELRHYTLVQFWVFGPLFLVVLALWPGRRR